MKKMMFNDRYGLTEAVLSGRKTQTRRIIPKDFFTLTWDEREDTLVYENDMGDFIDICESRYAQYKVGEVVAIAQSYADISLDNFEYFVKAGYTKMKAGWNNKMFVRAYLMPHHIRITNVRVERLRDISHEDCLKEGVKPCSGICEGLYFCVGLNGGGDGFGDPVSPRVFSSPKLAYVAIIDKISGRGTWDSNPYVFVYDFELFD